MGIEQGGPKPEEMGISPEEKDREGPVTEEEEKEADTYFQNIIKEAQAKGEKPPTSMNWPPGSERPRVIYWNQEEFSRQFKEK